MPITLDELICFWKSYLETNGLKLQIERLEQINATIQYLEELKALRKQIGG